MEDPYDLERFVAAQNDLDMYDRALAELRRGMNQQVLDAFFAGIPDPATDQRL